MTATLTQPDAPQTATPDASTDASTNETWSPPDPTARARSPRTWRVRLTVLAALAACGVAMYFGDLSAVSIAFLFAISWPLERIWRRHPIKVRRIGLRTDLAYAASQVPLQFAGLVVAGIAGVLSLAWLPGLALRPLVSALPFWVHVVLGVLIFDFIVYWTHRWSHTVPLFWRFHAVHHSTIHLDWISGFRAHPLDGVFIAPAFAFVLAAGFDGVFVGGLAVLQFVIGLWSHLNVRWRFRPLRALVLTPDFHHWHHANEPDAINTNFSIVLPIWDIAFGSFYMPADKRPQRYGISQPMPNGIVQQLAHPFRGIRPELRQVWQRRFRRRRITT